MGINTVCHPPYSRNLAPCDFRLFPKLRGCRYETIEEMKEAVTKVIHTLTQKDFHGVFQKLLEQYNNCIAAGGDYFEGDKSINKSAHKKKVWKLISWSCVQINDWCWIVIVTWLCLKSFKCVQIKHLVSDSNTWSYLSVQKID